MNGRHVSRTPVTATMLLGSLMCTLVLTSPSAGAMSTLLIGGPFTGDAVEHFGRHGTTGCGGSISRTPAIFHSASGKFNANATASVVPCGGSRGLAIISQGLRITSQ